MKIGFFIASIILLLVGIQLISSEDTQRGKNLTYINRDIAISKKKIEELENAFMNIAVEINLLKTRLKLQKYKRK